MNFGAQAERRAMFAGLEGKGAKPISERFSLRESAPVFTPGAGLSSPINNTPPRRSLTVLGGQFRRVK